MASSVVVQFRYPAEKARFLEDREENLNEAARKALDRYVQALRMRDALDWILEHPAKKSFDPAATIREIRDES